MTIGPPPRPPQMPPAPLAAPRTTTGFTLDLKPRTAQTPIPRIMYYAVPGFGKTTFACSSPSPVVLSARDERGVQRLIDAGSVQPLPVIDINDWPTLLAALDSLATTKHDRKTIVLDSLGAFERLCHEHVIEKSFAGKAGDDGFMAFNKGVKVALGEWVKVLARLDTLHRMGFTIVLLGHAVVENFKNPNGNNFDRYSCRLDPLAWGAITAWTDCVWFGNYLTITKEYGSGKGAKSKGIGGTDRVVYTHRRDTHDAKPGYTMPEEIHIGDDPSKVWGEITQYIYGAQQ